MTACGGRSEIMSFAANTFGGDDVARKAEMIFRIICVCGFLVILGTAGASDADAISFEQVVARSTAGLALFAGGAYAGGLMR